MAAKGLSQEMMDNVRRVLCAELSARFGVRPGRKYPGGQRALAHHFHMSQATLGQCFLPPEGRAPKDFSIDVVLGIHRYFADVGRPMTLDELLGIAAPAPAPAPAPIDPGFTERLRQLEREVLELKEQLPPPGPSRDISPPSPRSSPPPRTVSSVRRRVAK